MIVQDDTILLLLDKNTVETEKGDEEQLLTNKEIVMPILYEEIPDAACY